MRRHRRGSVLRAALVMAVAAWSLAACELGVQTTASPTADATAPSTKAPADTPTPEPSVASVTLPSEPEGETVEATVLNVLDGDTVRVAIDGAVQEIQYLGLDAPELDEAGEADEPLAREALAANRGLVNGKTVLLEADATETDPAGRLLRYVWVDVNGTLRMVNHILLARGFAELLTDTPDTRYEIPLRLAEAAARERQAGIWAPDAAEPSEEPAESDEPAASAGPIVVEEETPIGAGQTAFRGGPGESRWTNIVFTSENNFAVRWSATSTSGACQMAWTLSGGESAGGDASLSEPGQGDGRALLKLEGGGASELSITTDCRKWLITFNEIKPAPTPAPTPEPTAEASVEPTLEPSPDPSASATT